MNATKAKEGAKVHGTDRPEGLRVPLRERVKPLNLAAMESCRWFHGPWSRRDPGSGFILDARGQQTASVDAAIRWYRDATKPEVEKLLALVVAAPLLLAAVEAYRTHCDAPLALTMAVDKLLESIE
jgi:hypothetical protein